jgi:hypothetical protein
MIWVGASPVDPSLEVSQNLWWEVVAHGIYVELMTTT